jgi:broad-specificity NMP kinase
MSESCVNRFCTEDLFERKRELDKGKIIQGCVDWERITPQLSNLATKPDVIVVITPQHTALKQRSKSRIYHKIKHSSTPLN